MMKKQAYRQIETEQGGMRVVLQFPEEDAKQACVVDEIRRILSGVLLECFDREKTDDLPECFDREKTDDPGWA